MFSTETLTVSTSDGWHFVLLEPFTYTALDGRVITVPVGTTSDGASTPREIWNFIPPFGTYWKAAFLHDYLYRDTQLPKVRCDDLLKEAMECLNVDPVEVKTIYEGVNLGGQCSFNQDRAAQTSTLSGPAAPAIS
jgi:hypothetical protein